MLSIIGLVIVIVAAIYAYKTARDYGRQAVLWAIATLAVGIGIQYVVPFILGIILALVYVAQGITDPMAIQERIMGPAMIIGIGCLVLSVVAMGMILKTLSKVPDEPAMPPPPPNIM
jgi:hypothetical protein